MWFVCIIHVVDKYTVAVSMMRMFAVIIYMYIVCACVELMYIIADIDHRKGLITYTN